MNSHFSKEYFEAITCFNVLEHLINPEKALYRAVELLKPGGIIIIEVPNIDSWGFRIFRKRWQLLQIPTHVNHFSKESISRLFSRANNMKVVDVSTFSLRICPAAFVLSLIPALTPKIIRRRHNGTYPFMHKIVYVLLQLIALPFVYVSYLIGRGCVIRAVFQKKYLS